MKTIKCRITFLEEVLGMTSANEELFKTYIASKAPDAPSREEEIELYGADAVEEKTTTVFPRGADGEPIFWDYQIKGFFKDSCGALRKAKGTESSKLTAYKKVIDGLIFPKPRQIKIHLAGDMGMCQRPLRASTAQGERIALASSETVPAGSWAEFEVLMLSDDHEKAVREWLEYGELKGTGQWRNSGKGRFSVEYIE